MAVLLVSLGEEAAADVLRQFGQDEVGEIAQAEGEGEAVKRPPLRTLGLLTTLEDAGIQWTAKENEGG